MVSLKSFRDLANCIQLWFYALLDTTSAFCTGGNEKFKITMYVLPLFFLGISLLLFFTLVCRYK